MTWVAVDDRLYTDPRFIGLSGDAAKLYVATYTWAGDHLTDGLVTDATAAVLARMYRMKNPEAVAAELLASGLWTALPEGHAIAGFLDHNRPASDREAARRATRERVKNWREQQRRNAVTSEGSSVPEPPGNAVTGGAVTRPQIQIQRQDSYSRRDSTSARRTRKGAAESENGFATEDEMRDADAAALAEELAE